MRKWLVKFNQRFNGRISTCYVTVKAHSVYDALEEFDRIGYVNVDVKAVRVMWQNDRFDANGDSRGDGDAQPEGGDEWSR